jgi:hypothetical protein
MSFLRPPSFGHEEKPGRPDSTLSLARKSRKCSFDQETQPRPSDTVWRLNEGKNLGRYRSRLSEHGQSSVFDITFKGVFIMLQTIEAFIKQYHDNMELSRKEKVLSSLIRRSSFYSRKLESVAKEISLTDPDFENCVKTVNEFIDQFGDEMKGKY